LQKGCTPRQELGRGPAIAKWRLVTRLLGLPLSGGGKVRAGVKDNYYNIKDVML
jgi:hypothetical protein